MQIIVMHDVTKYKVPCKKIYWSAPAHPKGLRSISDTPAGHPVIFDTNVFVNLISLYKKFDVPCHGQLLKKLFIYQI